MSQMYTDEDVDDLIRINIELTKENNRLLKKMRRTQVWYSVFRVMWLVVLISAPVALYLYFLQPYVEEAREIYQETKESIEHIRQMQENFQTAVSQVSARFGGMVRGE